MNIRKAEFDEENHVYRDPKSGLVVPSVTQLRDKYGFGHNYEFVDAETMETTRQLGTELDSAIAYIEQGYVIEDIDDRVKACIDGYLKLKEVAKWKPLVIHNGETGPAVADVWGMPVGFCPDMLGMLDGEETVVEIKRTSVISPSVGFQTAGYDACLGSNELSRRRAVFQLLPGKFKVWDSRETNSRIFNSGDYDAFRSALYLYWYGKNRGINGK